MHGKQKGTEQQPLSRKSDVCTLMHAPASSSARAQ
eukprot:CAMPEP_0181205552 /NCGR_PEP_ID=MMETSP1096-20121128/20544_1 /TAXON_ID=156174 ORGANISM="Chrysochromulina ericina, Strain CCMP281" /NCGR_SAMPLE_ID=MMETSP1096 /ASSEMBLY_ACC=CAM_ASM_000453 /LENGTH=34 /DNA_ID= /DNA_START= /DNA_END= /DNA_ORIENTATION=